ncbi:MAG: leucine--tRNA ligase [Actinomycetota bacterium]
MSDRYEPGSFEEQWMRDWERRELYAAPEKPVAQKRFVMEMFPYPSGDLHMGHVENYSIADVMARYWRMTGWEVMHPMGYDAFGLPSENAAIERGIHPRQWTMGNVEQMRSSFKRLGFSYDWDREVISSNEDYYRWNQWIFLKLYERGLAYRKTAPVNWCPVDKTVLAREQLSTGVCWRCGSPPEIRELTQWFLKITDYSDRLLDEMEGLQWSDSILNQQRHWIGRSHGAEVSYRIKRPGGETIEVPVFTTRPDTLWGATFFVLAPEHPLAGELASGTEAEETFERFLDEVRRETEVERLAGKGIRKGIALPATAINPVNGEEIPVWTADYVLTGYGTGAVMGVPAHDQRDFQFARQFGLEVRVVIRPEGEESGEEPAQAYDGPGVMVNSGPFDGTVVFPETGEGIDEVIEWLEKEGRGRGATYYRQRDWLVSRQRYWGTPIPIVHCPDCGEVPVPYEDLPVRLPDEVDYTPSDESVAPLGKMTEFVETTCPRCGGPARRETDTLDTFFDSSWYFLRYCDPHNMQEPFAPEKVAAWCPVDMYVGGTEHAVMHLIYARFFIKVFQDMRLLEFPEPFLTLFNQGSVSLGGEEMSSSKGNAIDAHDVIDRYGADTARLFILFCSPPSDAYDFPTEGGMELIGRVAHGWLVRLWRVLWEVGGEESPEHLRRAVNRTVKAVTDDMESFGFNTAVARMMELVNEFSKLDGPVPRSAAETFLKLLAPVAPYITEELWHRYGNTDSIHLEVWPVHDENLLATEMVTMIVQVNGKVRDRIDVPASIDEEQMKALALASDRVRRHLDGHEPRKVIVRPPHLVNLVL